MIDAPGEARARILFQTIRSGVLEAGTNRKLESLELVVEKRAEIPSPDEAQWRSQRGNCDPELYAGRMAEFRQTEVLVLGQYFAGVGEEDSADRVGNRQVEFKVGTEKPIAAEGETEIVP